jgi:hypothetical protein
MGLAVANRRHVSKDKGREETKRRLRCERAELDPIRLAEEIEKRLERIFNMVEKLEEDRADEIARASAQPVVGPVGKAPNPHKPNQPKPSAVCHES